jgi:chemotaxis response regulator CheB
VEGASGVWKGLTDNVNQLAETLTTQLRAIADVSTAVTSGDLTRSITVEAAGEVSDHLKDERVQYARPSIDVLFESVAEAYRNRAIGIVLTGANEDGAAGLAAIKRQGGVTIVQDPRTAERRVMPDAAIALSLADAILPLDEIGPYLSSLCQP